MVETSQPKLFVLPGSQSLADADASRPRIASASTLRQQLNGELSGYDFVFLDCPPRWGSSLGRHSGASAEVYIPIQCEYFAMEGLSQIIELARQTKAKDNHRLEIGGIVLTMHDPDARPRQRGCRRSPRPTSRRPSSRHSSLAMFISAKRPSHGVSVLDHSREPRAPWAYAELPWRSSTVNKRRLGRGLESLLGRDEGGFDPGSGRGQPTWLSWRST